MLDKRVLMNAVALGFIDQDGAADAVPALRAFVAACVQKGETAGYLPGLPANKKGYRFKSLPLYGHPELGLTIPSGFTLIGDGPDRTRFYQDPVSFEGATAWPTHGFIFVESGARLSGMSFDGQRDLIARGAETTFTSTFVQAAAPATSHVILTDVAATGNVGGLSESFCVSTGLQSRAWTFEAVRCDRNNGSGISLNGDMLQERTLPGTGLTSGHFVRGCSASQNTWQGLTAYGCRDSLIQDFVADGNGALARWAGNGINVEWSYNIHVVNPICRGNVGGGIGGYGDNAGLEVLNPTLEGNNVRQSPGLAEIAFSVGHWWNESKGPVSGLLRDLVVMGGTVEPRGAAAFHLHVGRTDGQRRPLVVSDPRPGVAALPRVLVSGVRGLTRREAWQLTSFTDREGLTVAP